MPSTRIASETMRQATNDNSMFANGTENIDVLIIMSVVERCTVLFVEHQSRRQKFYIGQSTYPGHIVIVACILLIVFKIVGGMSLFCWGLDRGFGHNERQD